MKLLSPLPFSQYSALDYHAYIKSLNKPKEFVSSKKEQKDLKVRVKRKKDGTLSLVTKRNPLYVTEKEIEIISKETTIPQSELFITFRERGYVIARDHRSVSRSSGELNKKTP